MEQDEHLVEPAIEPATAGCWLTASTPACSKKTAELLEHEARWDEAADFGFHTFAPSANPPRTSTSASAFADCGR
ncbi:MAG: hypothetical protein CM1200mP34_0620 [Verrucomicrobiales bacterium]|nr:MAG: hypothetical protein CM1200mP34_0620 [Verrucomicrobiales bacterium]